MNMFDEARSLDTMIKTYNFSQGEIAGKLGVSQSYIANKLRLLKLDKNMQSEIVRARLTERHARALLRLKSTELQARALAKIKERNLSVRESEALIDFLADTTAPERISRAEAISRVDTFKSTLSASLKTLTALGVHATHTYSYYGKKTYITVCIEEP